MRWTRKKRQLLRIILSARNTSSAFVYTTAPSPQGEDFFQRSLKNNLYRIVLLPYCTSRETKAEHVKPPYNPHSLNSPTISLLIRVFRIDFIHSSQKTVKAGAFAPACAVLSILFYFFRISWTAASDDVFRIQYDYFHFQTFVFFHNQFSLKYAIAA